MHYVIEMHFDPATESASSDCPETGGHMTLVNAENFQQKIAGSFASLTGECLIFPWIQIPKFYT